MDTKQKKCSKIRLLAATSYGFESHRRHDEDSEILDFQGFRFFVFMDIWTRMDTNGHAHSRPDRASETVFPTVSACIGWR